MESLDQLLEATGCFGRFQLYMVLALSLPTFGAGWSMMQVQFIDLAPDFHCVINGRLNDSTLNTQTSNSTLNVCSVNGTPCDTYAFVNTWLTTVTRWNLVCDRKWIKNLLQSFQLAGQLIGTLLIGQLSDWYGRKITTLGFVLLLSLGNFLASLSSTWEMFALCRILIGVGSSGITTLQTPYAVEFLSSKWRSALLLFPTYALSVACSAGVDALIPNIVYLHLIVACIVAVALPGLFFLPEGPRWLLVNEHIDEAEKVMQKIAKANKRSVPENMRTLMTNISRQGENSDGQRQTYSCLHLFIGWPVLKVTCIGGFVGISSAVLFVGIAFNISGLAGNVFWNIFFMSVGEIPASMSILFLNNWLGRRATVFLFFLLVTISQAGCLLVLFAIPGGELELGFVVTILCFVANICVNSALGAFSVWRVELYPTVIRNAGYSFQVLMYRVGAVAAPFIIDLSDRKRMSMIILTVLMLLTTFLVLALPETKDKEMTEYTTIPTTSTHQNVSESDRLTDGIRPRYCIDLETEQLLKPHEK